MKKLKKLIKSGHAQVEGALAINIIVLAYVATRELTRPISYLEFSIAALLMAGYEGVARSKKTANAWFVDPAYWVAAIVVATALIIMRHMV
ncbi:MAG: hypothetical protein GY839_20040 [candidate division Zixibacteria bacterium]|nr:hypothetical protein [candidate division Zixibacteria bacterium]